jgi:hypothetical protein
MEYAFQLTEILDKEEYIPGPGKLGIVVDAREKQNSTSVCLAVPTNYLLLTELTVRFTSPVATEPPAHFAPTLVRCTDEQKARIAYQMEFQRLLATLGL